MSRRRASQLFYVFIGARRRECLIAAQNEKKNRGGFVHTCRQCVPVMISPHERKLISACVRHMNTVTH